MSPRAGLLPLMLLSGCMMPGSPITPPPPIVEIAPVEASAPVLAEPREAVAAERPRPLPARTVDDPVEPASSPPLPGTTDKYAGSVGLGFAAPSQPDVKSSCTLNGKQLWGK